jgi:adenine deaminase
MNTKNETSQKEAHDLKKAKADIFLTGGIVLNVYSGELLKTNIAIKGERIWYVGPSSDVVSKDTQVLDTLIPIFTHGSFITPYHLVKKHAVLGPPPFSVTI